jgi:hypothetical protein
MPLPFIVAGVALAVSGVVGAAAKSVNRDYEEKLASINRQIQNLAKQTDESYRSTQEAVKGKIETWNFMKSEVYTYTFPKFVESFGKLKKVDYKEGQLSLDLVKDIKESTVNYRLNHSGGDVGTEDQAMLKGAILGAVGGGLFFIGSLVKGVKLQYAIDEAEANLAKLKLEVEKVKTAETKLKQIGKRAEELTDVTRTLNDLFKLALHQLEVNIAKFGSDYSTYNSETRQQVYVVAESAKTMRVIMNVQLLNSSGSLNPKVNEIIKTSRATMESTANG